MGLPMRAKEFLDVARDRGSPVREIDRDSAQKASVPKLISKVLPIYLTEARKQRVSADVVIDVSLKHDGTVAHVDVIDGNSLLTESAISAVKQWRYQPLVVKAKPVLKLVVAISFGKGGKVQ